MNPRGEIKKKHERAMIAAFLDWYNSAYRAGFAVESEPDPPEAILRDGETRTWIELATVFASDDWAQDVWSGVTPGEQHVSVAGRVFRDVDPVLVARFVAVIQKKRSKPSYVPFKDTYGPGILLLDLHSPWFREDVLRNLRQGYKEARWSGDLDCFDRLFISYILPLPSDGRLGFQEWARV